MTQGYEFLKKNLENLSIIQTAQKYKKQEISEL